MLGCLLPLLTFPGVMVHEFGHLVFCWLLGIRVHKVCLFRLGNPAGYVLHEEPGDALQHLLICFGPFFANTIIGAAIAAPAAIRLRHFPLDRPWDYLFLWLGIAIAMHAFPSTGDTASLWEGIWQGRGCCLARLIALPFVGLMYLIALGKIFMLDLIYGVAVAVLLPRLLMQWLVLMR